MPFPPPVAGEQHLVLGAWRRVMASFLHLAVSLVMARFLSVGALLVFSYFVGPEPFASYGLYIAIVTILWIGVFGCYEQALFVCPDHEIAPIARLSCTVAALVIAVVALVCLIIAMVHPAFLDTLDGFSLVIVAIPFALAARASHRLLSNMATRAGTFVLVARSNWAQATVQGCLLLALLAAGMPAIVCLVAADVAGLAAVTAIIAAKLPQCRSILLAKLPKSALLSCARSWAAMPSWRLPMSLTSVAALSLPALTLPLFFPAALAGQLVFAMRILEIPSNVISDAASPMFQSQLSSRQRSRRFAVRAVVALTALAVATFGIIAMVAWSLIPAFHETRWATGLASVAPLVIYFIGLTISAPLVGSVIGVAVEHSAAMWQLVFLGLSAGAVALMAGGLPLFWVLVAFGMASLLRALLFGKLYLRQYPREGVEQYGA